LEVTTRNYVLKRGIKIIIIIIIIIVIINDITEAFENCFKEIKDCSKQRIKK